MIKLFIAVVVLVQFDLDIRWWITLGVVALVDAYEYFTVNKQIFKNHKTIEDIILRIEGYNIQVVNKMSKFIKD